MAGRNQKKEDQLRWRARRLQKLCRAVGIDGPTQLATAIARAAGDPTPTNQLSVSGAAGWWNGTREPSITNLLSIIGVTGGSADWLLLEAGDMFSADPQAKERAFDQIVAIVDQFRAELTPSRDGAAGGLVDELRPLEKARRAPRKRKRTG